MSGWVHRASTARLPPWTMLSTPGGTPACSASSASSIGVIGSCSEGLSTKVLPQTMAIGNIHSGIIAGKVERRDAGAHADRLADGVGVHAARDVFGELAELQGADRAGVLDHLESAEYVALGIRQGLALLGAQGRARSGSCVRAPAPAA